MTDVGTADVDEYAYTINGHGRSRRRVAPPMRPNLAEARLVIEGVRKQLGGGAKRHA